MNWKALIKTILTIIGGILLIAAILGAVYGIFYLMLYIPLWLGVPGDTPLAVVLGGEVIIVASICFFVLVFLNIYEGYCEEDEDEDDYLTEEEVEEMFDKFKKRRKERNN